MESGWTFWIPPPAEMEIMGRTKQELQDFWDEIRSMVIILIYSQFPDQTPHTFFLDSYIPIFIINLFSSLFECQPRWLNTHNHCLITISITIIINFVSGTSTISFLFLLDLFYLSCEKLNLIDFLFYDMFSKKLVTYTRLLTHHYPKESVVTNPSWRKKLILKWPQHRVMFD